MDNQLKILKKFQDKYPNSHVGGSFGLFLNGIDLKRSLYFSDLDITIDEFTPKKDGNVEECSSDDFDYRIEIINPVTKHSFKIDVRISPNQEFDIINHDGVNYNVTKKEEILRWKLIYAQKGVEKHINDLFTIATGIRTNNNGKI